MRVAACMMAGLLLGGTVAGGDLGAAKAKFAKWDKQLNAVYGELRKGLPAPLFEKVREDQRAWVEHRDYLAEWEPKAQGKTPAEDPAYWERAATLTESRIAYLKAWNGIGEGGDWSGVYRDGYGGELKIVERGGKLFLTLEVVRGPTHHTGKIGGAARVNGRTAWFSVVPEAGESPTWLTFLNNREGDGRIEIVGENTQFFHGARAYFDGRYLRVGVLSGTAAEKVIEESAESNR